MSFRTTLLLLLLLAGLGGYVYWVEYPASLEEVKTQKLYEFAADDASEVTLTYADREVVLSKRGEDWRLSKPLDVAADASTAKNLVGALADCEIKKELSDAASDLATYGLDKPFVTVQVKVKDKQLPAVSFGKTTPIGGAAYVQRSDDKKILLANGACRSSLDKQVKDLRDKTIVTFSDEELQRIEISGDDKDIVLVKKDDAWSIERPGPYAADASNVRSFLSSLRALRASEFPDDAPSDLSAYGLATPHLTIRLFLGRDQVETAIRFGSSQADKKEPYVQTSAAPTVYAVSEFSVKELNKGANDFRDKTVLAFAKDDAAAIGVQRQDGSHFKLIRGDDQQWRAEAVEGKPATAILSQYVADLHDLKGYEIVADNPPDVSAFGLDSPLLTIRILNAEQQPLGTIRIAERPSSEGKKEFVAMADGAQSVYLVRDYTVTRLNKQAKDFIEPPPAAPNAAPPAAGDPHEMPFGDEDLADEDY